MFRPQGPPPQAPAPKLYDELETYQDLYCWRQHNPGRLPQNRAYIGISGDLIFGEPNHNVLVLGPSQGGGKTAGVAVPQAMSCTGPLVFVTSKIASAEPAAYVRSLLGEVWHYGPDSDEVPPGMKELRYSPILMCTDWGVAQLTATAMVEASRDPSGKGNADSDYFHLQSAYCLATLLFYAAQFGEEMGFVLSLVDNPRPGGNGRFGLRDMVRNLEERGFAEVAEAMAGIASYPEKQRSGVFSTAALAVRPYAMPTVMASTRNPNFDVDAFVAGDPDVERPEMVTEGLPLEGQYDSVFITAAEQDRNIAPVITAFLAQLRSRRRKLFRKDNGYGPDARPERPPLTFVLDELATMAPIYDLPKQLAIGNEGIITIGVLQDLSQAKAIWGPETGKGILTLFQNVIVFRGLRDEETLRAISNLCGMIWIPVEGWNEGNSKAGLFDPVNESSGYSVHQQQVPAVPVSAIAQGPPQYPDAVLWLRADGSFKWVHNAPYFRSKPWTPILVKAMEQIAQMDKDDSRRQLRVPRLFHGYNGGPYGLWKWEGRYWDAKFLIERGRRS